MKNLPFMREIAYMMGTIDARLLVDFVLGLPMLGWACQAPSQIQRERLPEYSIDELLAQSEHQNRRLIARTKASGDAELDRRAWAKTVEEVEDAMSESTMPATTSSSSLVLVTLVAHEMEDSRYATRT